MMLTMKTPTYSVSQSLSCPSRPDYILTPPRCLGNKPIDGGGAEGSTASTGRSTPTTGGRGGGGDKTTCIASAKVLVNNVDPVLVSDTTIVLAEVLIHLV